MIRVIYEPRISSTHIKDEIWYPEININADEYYSYLYHKAGRIMGLTVITYSPIILFCLQVIAEKLNIELQVEMNDECYIGSLESVYKVHASVMQYTENKKWELEDSE